MATDVPKATFLFQNVTNFVPIFESLPVVEFQISTDILKAERIIFHCSWNEKSPFSLLQGEKSPPKRATHQKLPKSQKNRFLLFGLKRSEICWNMLSRWNFHKKSDFKKFLGYRTFSQKESLRKNSKIFKNLIFVFWSKTVRNMLKRALPVKLSRKNRF